MVDPEAVRRRIREIDRRLGFLRAIQAVGRDTFLVDEAVRAQAERHLQLAIQAAIDIANHIVAEESSETPEDYPSAFSALASIGVIDMDFASRLRLAAGLRNILVHAYLDVDPAILWESLDRLDDLERLAARSRPSSKVSTDLVRWRRRRAARTRLAVHMRGRGPSSAHDTFHVEAIDRRGSRTARRSPGPMGRRSPRRGSTSAGCRIPRRGRQPAVLCGVPRDSGDAARPWQVQQDAVGADRVVRRDLRARSAPGASVGPAGSGRLRVRESVLPRETIVHNIGEVESFVARCTEIVAEEEARGADEPDPPADY